MGPGLGWDPYGLANLTPPSVRNTPAIASPCLRPTPEGPPVTTCDCPKLTGDDFETAQALLVLSQNPRRRKPGQSNPAAWHSDHCSITAFACRLLFRKAASAASWT